jgi:hypothetical protein
MGHPGTRRSGEKYFLILRESEVSGGIVTR